MAYKNDGESSARKYAPMGIDITKVKDEHLLEVLGEGDWEIAIPSNLPDLIVTRHWRQTIRDRVHDWFVRWVIKGIDHQVHHDYDPPWDHSGNAKSIPTDSIILLTRHELLAEWLEEERTGQNPATYTSGYGLHWRTFDDELFELVQEMVHELVSSYWRRVHNYPDDHDLFDDPVWDELDLEIICLEQALREYAGQLTTKQVWKEKAATVRARIERERIEYEVRAEQHREVDQKIREVWRAFFPDLAYTRIEMPQFREMGLEARIGDILADLDPQIVEAVATGHYTPPFNCSNSVRDTIWWMARHALTNLK